MIGMNLSGANGKQHPDKHILGAIIGTVSQQTLKLLIITLVSYMYIQYCAKVMKTIIDEYRDILAIYRRYLTRFYLKRYIQRYIVRAIVLFVGEISFPLCNISFQLCEISFPLCDISFLLCDISFLLCDISFLLKEISFQFIVTALGNTRILPQR